MTVLRAHADRKMLGIFLKYPTPGQVKTRLAEVMGADAAATCYREMADLVLAHTAEADAYRRTLFITPKERILDFVRWLPDETFLPQRGEDLGARMADAISRLLAQGDCAVLIGSDVPDISAAMIAEAFDHLQHHDLVIGPALDGGYYLIGMKQLHPPLFEDIAWSTPEVLAETLRKAEALGLSCALLPQLADIDTIEDYRKWEEKSRSQK
jgi:hypothetical protein